jgi:predicted TPR repeat methyltransferase
LTGQETDAAAAGTRDTLLAQAIQAHQAGRGAEADGLYREILERDASDADALHFLGLLRFQQGHADQAETLLRRSLKSAPHNAHAWNNLGNVLFAVERHADAADAYIRAVDLDMELAAPWRNLGECLERSGSPEAAIRLYRHIIETVPGMVPAYEVLGRVLRVLGRPAEAIEVYRRWVALEPNRATARHLLSAMSGCEVPERASDAYMRELFDGFAPDFDDKLARLEYQAPALVLEALRRATPSGASLRILDAGCGTGLCAGLLRPLAAELVGVDLSAGMLAKAAGRKAYDALEQAELTAYMERVPGRFDAVVCVDTLCYFGSLTSVFAATRRVLAPRGLFAFSVEHLATAGEAAEYAIQPHGRYQHSRDYLVRALREAGFIVHSIEEVILRQEVFVDVPGLVVVALVPGVSTGTQDR